MSLQEPYYQDDHCAIYNADCREVLPHLEPVDLVLTDPPYGIKIADWDCRVPHELLTEFLRLTDGPVVWFGASSQHRNDLMSFAPEPQRILIWHPRFTLSKTMACGIAYRWHPVYCWQLPKKHNGPKWDVLTHCCDGHNGWNHPATKPIKLISELCGLCSSGIVLDPFMGSGTTLLAAKNRNLKAIGIEIERDYCDIAIKRLRQGVLPL